MRKREAYVRVCVCVGEDIKTESIIFHFRKPVNGLKYLTEETAM